MKRESFNFADEESSPCREDGNVQTRRIDKTIRPSRIELHPCEACNYDCVFCINGSWRRSKGANKEMLPYLSRDSLFRIVQDAKAIGVKELSFSGGGEPLLNPHTIEAMVLANKNGLATKLVTNGSLLTSEGDEVWLRCKELCVSINAASEGIYNQVNHPPTNGAFETVTRRVGELVECKNREQWPVRVKLIFQIIKHNYREIEAFVDLAAELGVDATLFEFPYQIAAEAMCPQAKRKDIVTQIARTAVQYEERLRVEFSEGTEHNTPGASSQLRKCMVPFCKLTISGDGGVFPCCQLADQGGEVYGDLLLGRIDHGHRLKDILDSQRAYETVIKIDPQRCPPCIPSEHRINKTFLIG